MTNKPFSELADVTAGVGRGAAVLAFFCCGLAGADLLAAGPVFGERTFCAIAIWLVLLVACGTWISQRLVLTTDMSAFLPPAATQAQEILIGQLRSGVASKLLLVGLEGADASASTALAEKLAASGLFETVANGEGARAARRTWISSSRCAMS